MNRFCEGLTIVCVLLVSIASTTQAEPAMTTADERAALQSVRASHLASTGRCAEAIQVADTMSSRDAKTELMIGKCAVSAQDYGRAITALDRAANLDPTLPGVNLYRGMSLYHLNNLDGARGALANARTSGEETALLDFYTGLLLLRDDRSRESALAFERAAARGPNLVEPMASHYAALAWQSIDENEPFQSAVDRVAVLDPDGPWAQEAERLVGFQAERHRAGQTGLQRWASLKAGTEYDSNVVLRGNGVDLDLEGGDSDWRDVWGAMLGAELWEKNEWTVGALVNYAGTAHADHDVFDQHYASLTAWVDNEIRATTRARLRVNFGYGWFDGDPYRINIDIVAIGEERWGRFGTTRCSLGTNIYDYRYDLDDLLDTGDVFADDIDQDGVDLLVGCGHEITLAAIERIEPTLYGDYQFSNYFAEGVEWDHRAHRILLGLRLAMPYNIDFDARGTYTRRDFRGATHFAVPPDEESQTGPHRNDDAFQADVELSKEFIDFVVLSARYQYIDNGSSAMAFDFKRHVAGAYVELKFP